MTLDHLAHAEGQADRDDGRQAFRHRRDGEAHRDQKRFDDGCAGRREERAQAAVRGQDQIEVGFAQDFDDEHQAADRQRASAEDFAQFVEFVLQRRGFFFKRLDQLGDEADLRLHARAGDDAKAASVGDGRAHVGGVLAIAERNIGLEDGRRLFLHGDGFTRQR